MQVKRFHMLLIVVEGKYGTAHSVSGWSRRDSENTRSTWCQSQRPVTGRTSFCVKCIWTIILFLYCNVYTGRIDLDRLEASLPL